MRPELSPDVLRRFILGKQGLWPGRRWGAKEGVSEALLQVEGVQIDPVSVLAQSQDLVLWGRVLDYQPSYLDDLLYKQRRAFDYGTALFIYPISELPYWRVHMDRIKGEERWMGFATENPDAIDRVKAAIRQAGPLRKRDLDGNQVSNYRGSRDTGVALHYLWLIGELMTHHRQGKERFYDFRENIAPEPYSYHATIQDAEDFFAHKAVAMQGLVTKRLFRNGWMGMVRRPVSQDEAGKKIEELLDRKVIVQVEVLSQKEPAFIMSGDVPSLEDLIDSKIPRSWRPVGEPAGEEVILLSPLEYVSARGRAKKLFDFEYVWEIYKPEALRRWGPYTTPILYGDRLVGRVDARADRPAKALVINGMWLEGWFEPDLTFIEALGRGIARFVSFLDLERVDLENVSPDPFRRNIESWLEKNR